MKIHGLWLIALAVGVPLMAQEAETTERPLDADKVIDIYPGSRRRAVRVGHGRNKSPIPRGAAVADAWCATWFVRPSRFSAHRTTHAPQGAR